MKEALMKQEEELLNKIMLTNEDSELYEAGKRYAAIPVPEGLKDMIRNTLQEHQKERRRKARAGRMKKGARIALKTMGSLAAAIVIFMIPLNTNEAFAEQIQDIPVLGTLAKVLTIRSYSYTENDMNVSVNAPEVVEENPADTFIADVNAEIAGIVETYEADAKQRFEEYKRAFFETGGTEEEWGGRTCDIDVDYRVTYNEGAVLSLILTTTESWAAVYGQQYFYNLDMQNDRYLTLADMLGEDWVQICNESIVAQIEERIADEDACYWGYGRDADDDMGIEGFTSVSDQTRFYINADGNVVVCFDKYEIAPGYMGWQEFEIVR